jgi:alkylated DNA repair dioxygenase AlkB
MKILRHAEQAKLFDLPQSLPNGLVYRPDFITPAEEEVIIAYIENLALQNATHTVHTAEEDLVISARRRHMGFGWGWDYRRKKLIPGEPLPRFLHGAQKKIAKWLQIEPGRVAEALINEYTPDTALGWHVDNEGFEKIIGVSLSGWCKMRFRPLKGFKEKKDAGDVVSSVELEPRSAYIMQGPVRWQWQHSVAPVKKLRYSITFRTLPQSNLI